MLLIDEREIDACKHRVLKYVIIGRIDEMREAFAALRASARKLEVTDADVEAAWAAFDASDGHGMRAALESFIRAKEGTT